MCVCMYVYIYSYTENQACLLNSVYLSVEYCLANKQLSHTKCILAASIPLT